MQDMAAVFEDDVTQALIPFVDTTFRTLADRDHRAMAGLSMGGMQTFQITLNHLDLFSYIGGFSGAAGYLVFEDRKLDPKTDYNGVFADPAAFAKKVHVLWLGVGTQEPERMRPGLLRLHAALDEAQHQARLLRIAGHGSRVADLAPRSEGLRAETLLKTPHSAVAAASRCCGHRSPPPASSTREEADGKAAALVAQLTLDEKVDQLLNAAPAIPRLGIPAYNWWTESLHGAIGEVPTTNFPEPIGLAATFDEPLLHDVAGAISVEVRALHALGRKTGRLGRIGTGLDTWSPNINIFRDPRWGRGQETYGEDPFLTARLAVAFVRGMQGPDPDHPHVIAIAEALRRAQRPRIHASRGERLRHAARSRGHLPAGVSRRHRRGPSRLDHVRLQPRRTASRRAPATCC